MAGAKRWVIGLALTGMAGLLLLIAAERFARPELIGPGLLLFAAGIFAAGADAVLRQYTFERNRPGWITDVFTGPAAQLIGVAMVIVAAGIAVAGASFVAGRQEDLYRYVLARPGVALVPIGSSLAAVGCARVLGAREWRGSAWRLVGSLPHRLAGALLMVLGLALAATGVVEIVVPDMFDAALERILAAPGPGLRGGSRTR